MPAVEHTTYVTDTAIQSGPGQVSSMYGYHHAPPRPCDPAGPIAGQPSFIQPLNQTHPSDQVGSSSATCQYPSPWTTMREPHDQGHTAPFKPLPPPRNPSASPFSADELLPSQITLDLPDAQLLSKVMQSDLERFNDKDKLHWAQDTIRLLDRTLRPLGGGEALTPAATIAKTTPLYPLITAAVNIIVSMLSCEDVALAAAAYYVKAHLLSSGHVPQELGLGMQKDPRQAFKDFETSARGGHARAWFRLGKEYEICGDSDRARGCFEKGVEQNDGECLYVSSGLNIKYHITPTY